MPTVGPQEKVTVGRGNKQSYDYYPRDFDNNKCGKTSDATYKRNLLLEYNF